MQMAVVCYHCPNAAALVKQPVSGPFKAADHMLQADTCSCSAYSLQIQNKRQDYTFLRHSMRSLVLYRAAHVVLSAQVSRKCLILDLAPPSNQALVPFISTSSLSLPVGMQASDLLESALANFTAARHGIATLAQSSTQSQLLTEEKVCSDLNADGCTFVMPLCVYSRLLF